MLTAQKIRQLIVAFVSLWISEEITGFIVFFISSPTTWKIRWTIVALISLLAAQKIRRFINRLISSLVTRKIYRLITSLAILADSKEKNGVSMRPALGGVMLTSVCVWLVLRECPGSCQRLK